MAGDRTRPLSWIPYHFDVLTSANSTAVSFDSTTVDARALIISVETNDVRVRFDSTAPTASTGVLFQKVNSPYFIDPYNGADWKFIKAAGGTATISIAAFKRPGD